MINFTTQSRACTKCSVEKESSCFSKGQYYCKECATNIYNEWKLKNKDVLQERYKRQWDENKLGLTEQSREYLRKKRMYCRKSIFKIKYGMDFDAIRAMYNTQGGKCSICECKINPVKEDNSTGGCFVIDHDHKNGKVRGLLCSSCNFAIGHFNDNITNMYSAIEYIKKSITQ